MTSRRLPIRPCTLLLAAGLIFGTAAAYGQGSFLETLAGPGETVELTYGRFDDGTGGKLITRTTPDGGTSLEIEGRVHLQSPNLVLRSHYLYYDAEKDILIARGEVFVEQPDAVVTSDDLHYDLTENLMILTGNVAVTQEAFTARSERLEYDSDDDHFILTGTPVVDQHTPENKGHFEGMEVLDITRADDGTVRVLMTGGEEIICEIEPADSEDTPAASASESGGGAFGGLGDRVRIVTRPLGQQEATVSMSTTEEGEMGQFYARGSVFLESEGMNLRAEQLQYDALGETIEALRNVTIRQVDVDAECGLMVYDLAEERIHLSIDPLVRQRRPGGYLVISDVESVVLHPGPDGETMMETNPLPDRDSRTQFVPDEEEPRQPGEFRPIEIPIDDDEELQRVLP